MNAEFNQLSRTAIEFKIIGNNYVEFINKAIGTFIVSKTVLCTMSYLDKLGVESRTCQHVPIGQWAVGNLIDLYSAGNTDFP